jgi:predicted dithiol-disulfide oxidoreductase (DUF899 family)
VRIEKEYTFETNEGTKALAELFDGRSQLLVYHFMFGIGALRPKVEDLSPPPTVADQEGS